MAALPAAERLMFGRAARQGRPVLFAVCDDWRRPDLHAEWVPAGACPRAARSADPWSGVTIKVRHFDTGKVGQPDALQAAKPIERRCTSLAVNPVERVVVVMKDGAARKAPLAAVLFDQLARVAAGQKATVIAVL